MQIVIPMSGIGKRFLKAGYSVPKPLIKIDGKPIIAHIIDMFPGENDFVFICNQEHLDEPKYELETVLKKYLPSGQIVGIPPHKLGPVNAVCQVEHMLDPIEPVIVNYCDFTCYWNYHHFKQFIKKIACVGAIPAYKGFHPHSLGGTNYAYIREKNGWIQDIQEKQPYTNDRMQEFASSGTYYFSSVQVMSAAFHATMDQGLNVGGEYYVSLAYKSLLANKQAVAVYPLQHFMQWGTPEDVDEYKMWSKTFRSLVAQQRSKQKNALGTLVVPMAGLGQRFTREGYPLSKPLISVSGLPMVVQATYDLPPTKQQVFILRSDMPGYKDISNTLRQIYPESIIKIVRGLTKGQACTALIGLDALAEVVSCVPEPIIIRACDNGALYNSKVLQQLIDNPKVDVIVWGIRSYPNAIRNTHMFGWIDSDRKGQIRFISVKSPLRQPATDPIVLGTFIFRRLEDFQRSLARLIADDGWINGEFYIDSLINSAIALGLQCHLFEVDSYLCWGTPNDLRTFEYWQSCFHKWSSHPYRLELDERVSKDQVNVLETSYQATVPVLPEVNNDQT